MGSALVGWLLLLLFVGVLALRALSLDPSPPPPSAPATGRRQGPVASFSAWGGTAYSFGLLENALTLHQFYPHYTLVAYVCRETCDHRVLGALADLAHVRLIPFDSRSEHGMLSRFRPAVEWDCEVVVVRDADSRFSASEKGAVDNWLKSGKAFHIMRHHPGHWGKILGGMFGALGTFLSPTRADFDRALARNARDHGDDMNYLEEAVYPMLTKSNSVIHSLEVYRTEAWAEAFPDGEPRLTGEDAEFVGKDVYTAPKAAALLGLDPSMTLSR